MSSFFHLSSLSPTIGSLFRRKKEADVDDVQVYISEAGFAAEESGRKEWDTTRCWDGYRCDGLMSCHMSLSCV